MEARANDKLRSLAGVLLLGVLGACAAPSLKDEEELGRQASMQIRQQVLVLHDDVLENYIDDIGQRLVQAAGPQPFEYTFTVVQNDDINAQATFGGNVFVNTGLIKRVRNVSELAGVLGHEVGHVVHRDQAAALQRAHSAGLLRDVAVIGSAIAGINPGAVDLVTQYSALGLLNTFTRDEERQADVFAIELLPRAGYDPNGMVNFFDVVSGMEGRTPPKFFSDHPTTPERIAATRALIAAKTLPPNLKRDDNGRLEIMQRRVKLLTGERDKQPRKASGAPHRNPNPI